MYLYACMQHPLHPPDTANLLDTWENAVQEIRCLYSPTAGFRLRAREASPRDVLVIVGSKTRRILQARSPGGFDPIVFYGESTRANQAQKFDHIRVPPSLAWRVQGNQSYLCRPPLSSSRQTNSSKLTETPKRL